MSEVDIEKLQTFLTARLNSEALFDDINVVSLRKLVIASEIDVSIVWLQSKTGSTKAGAGIVVGMPTIEVPEPNVSGPEMKVVIALRVEENPTVNMDATSGTQQTAEKIAINTLQNLHQLEMEGLCNIYAARKAVVPNTDLPGLVAYDVMLEGILPMQPPLQVNRPGIVSPAQVVTLTDTTGGATIYYTTDGSYPGKGSATAVVYAGPFAVAPGTVVQWAAYKAGMRGSDIGKATIN